MLGFLAFFGIWNELIYLLKIWLVGPVYDVTEISIIVMSYRTAWYMM